MRHLLAGEDLDSIIVHATFDQGFTDRRLVPGENESIFGLDGVTTQISCYKQQGDSASVPLLVFYLLASIVLLLNTLIAMMAETFNSVRAYQEEYYAHLNTQIVISAHLDQGDVPPP